MIALLRRVRPLEWALVIFVLFAVARAGPDVLLEWRELAGLRTVSVFFALALVGAVYLSRELISLPWRPGTEAHRRLLHVTLPLSLTPMGAAALFAIGSPGLHHQLSSIPVAQALPVVATVFLRVVGFGLPTFGLWLWLGLQLKSKGKLVLRAAAIEGLQRLGSALREWTPLLLLLSAYAWMDAVIGGRLSEERDAWMAAADRALFGGVDPLDLLERIISPPLSEWLAFAYSFYAVLYPLVFATMLMTGGRPAVREASFMVGIALVIAYISYSLIPVKGPLLTRTFTVPLDVYYIGPVKEALMDATRVTWDCFPSMHTCCTMLMAVAAWRHARRLFWFILPVVVSMPLACVYLRYHYVTDVLAGLVLAVVMVAVTAKLRPTFKET